MKIYCEFFYDDVLNWEPPAKTARKWGTIALVTKGINGQRKAAKEAQRSPCSPNSLLVLSQICIMLTFLVRIKSRLLVVLPCFVINRTHKVTSYPSP